VIEECQLAMRGMFMGICGLPARLRELVKEYLRIATEAGQLASDLSEVKKERDELKAKLEKEFKSSAIACEAFDDIRKALDRYY
jgi:hypothetical protein